MMQKDEQLSSIKTQLLDIFMSVEAERHQQKAKKAATRYYQARRGIELHREQRRLERHIRGDELAHHSGSP